MKTITSTFFISLFGIFLLFSTASALTVTNHNAPAYYFYPQEFDKLVLDFTVKPDADDTLNAVAVKNTGTARDFYEIEKMILWSDSGKVGFQGMGVDTKIGEMTYSGSSWHLSGLSVNVSQNGLRFFVSVETGKNAVSGRFFQMKIPTLTDSDEDGLFDAGDNGIYFNSQNNGPDAEILNSFTQSIKTIATDGSAPKTVIAEPLDGAKIYSSSYKIKGQARDQGGSSPQAVKIKIGSEEYNVTATGSNFSTWEYQWNNIKTGTYTIQPYGKDWIGNAGWGDEITVEVDARTVSGEKSQLKVDKTSALANGTAKITATVTAKDEAGNLLSEREAVLTLTPPQDARALNIASPQTAKTNSSGEAKFELSSSQVGSALLSVSIAGIKINQTAIIEFVSLSLSGGDLVQATGQEAIYWILNGKKRVFPHLNVYLSWGLPGDFSSVKKVSAAQLALYEQGEPVPFRDGSLFRGTMSSLHSKAAEAVFFVSGAKLYDIKSAEIYQSLFSDPNWQRVTWVPDDLLSKFNYPYGGLIDSSAVHPNGSIIRYAGSGKIYLISSGQKRAFAGSAFSENHYLNPSVIDILLTEIYSDGALITGKEDSLIYPS